MPNKVNPIHGNNEYLTIGNAGKLTVLKPSDHSVLKQIKLPLTGAKGEQYYVREICKIPDTPYFLAGYKNCIYLINVESGAIIMSFPVSGYVWTINLNPDLSAINYITDKGYGSIPFTDAIKSLKNKDIESSSDTGETVTGVRTLFSNSNAIRIHE